MLFSANAQPETPPDAAAQAATPAGSPDAAASPAWRILIEPAFMQAPLSWKIEGAKKSVRVPAIDTPNGPVELNREAFLKLGANKAEFEAKATQAASAALKELEPRWISDRSGIVIYAVLQSDNNLAASTVLAPEFPGLFKEKIGEDLLIAIPHRDLVYVFSRQDPEYRQRGNEIIDAYKDAIYPVSTEAFIFKDGTLQAVGEFSR